MLNLLKFRRAKKKQNETKLNRKHKYRRKHLSLHIVGRKYRRRRHRTTAKNGKLIADKRKKCAWFLSNRQTANRTEKPRIEKLENGIYKVNE